MNSSSSSSSPPKKDTTSAQSHSQPKPSEKSSGDSCSGGNEPQGLPPPSPAPAPAAVSKAPGWRLSSSSMLKLKQGRPRSTEDSLGGLGLTANIRSETSISSNGPLRSWFVNEKEQLKQLTPAMAKLSAELAKQYKYGSPSLEQKSPTTSKRSSGEEGSNGGGGGGGRRAILHCPVDPITGGYNDDLDLQQYKLILYEDNSEEEEGGTSGPAGGPNELSLRSGKEKTTLRGKVAQIAKVPPPKETSPPPPQVQPVDGAPKKSPPGTSPM